MKFEFITDPATPSEQLTAEAPGRVRFDDRGNAIYEWNDAQLQLDGQQGEALRERALLNPTLALVDDSPASNESLIRNFKGLRLGYNPYQSGQLAGKPAAKKNHTRELSKWIEMQRRLGRKQPA